MNNGNNGGSRCVEDGGETEVYSVSPSGSITYSNNEAATRTSAPSRNVVPSPTFSFKAEWQNFPEFQSWLRPVPGDKTKAWCQACEKVFKADLKSLRVHGVGRSHVRMVRTKFPEAAASSPPPAAVYNVITDRKGTYGLGILSKTESNPTAGSTLYVNPTNPNTNVLTCDPKQDKDNFVIVSMPKGESATQYDSHAAAASHKKSGDVESSSATGELKSRNAVKRSAVASAIIAANNAGCSVPATKVSRTTCESFAEELIDTEGTVHSKYNNYKIKI